MFVFGNIIFWENENKQETDSLTCINHTKLFLF